MAGGGDAIAKWFPVGEFLYLRLLNFQAVWSVGLGNPDQ